MVAPNENPPLDCETAQRLLRYEEHSGHFYWRVARAKKKAGSRAGSLKHTGYREIRIDGVGYLEHRLAWLFLNGRWPKAQVDHINNERSDNRACNLREATPQNNAANKRVSRISRSGLKGVYFNTVAKRWAAYIRHNGKGQTIGYYDTPVAASAAYMRRATELFGDYARAS